MIYDITRTVKTNTAVWPGDSKFQVETVLSRSEGESVNLTTITLSPHTGTHADAYFHYEDEGAHPAGMPLSAYVGKARVVTVSNRNGALTPDDFADGTFENAERLLIHSHVSDLPDDEWAQSFPYLSVELIERLSQARVVLVGLDSPSVDAFESKALPCHHALRRRGMVNLESLYLRDVPDGDYELIALPLKLDLTCGSPVRAILRSS